MGNATKQVPCTKSLNISSSNPFTNFKFDDIYVGYSGYYYRGYIFFNLPTPPENMGISSAYLKIYLTKNLFPNTSFNLYIYPLTEPFDNLTTYNNQPSYSNKYILYSINDQPCNWVTIDITNIVEDWYTGLIDNYGLLLKSDEIQDSFIGFYSNCCCNNLKPKLYINYSYAPNTHCISPIITKEQTWLLATPLVITSPVNVEKIIEGTFFIQNNGTNIITAQLQVSIDSIKWVNDNFMDILPSEIKTLVPLYYGKYYRVSLTSASTINAEIKFIYLQYK